jgi:isopentenyl diphosphate isomerase/L-lactate dehydrogenase-like FMN-dependent dehydrogenase
VPTAFSRLEAKARGAMSRAAYAYMAGGAGGEATMAANRAGFDAWRIVPRVLRDVSARDTSVELFGRRVPAPLLLGPIGVLGLAHREADVAVGRAAAAEGVPMVFSNQASRPMEEVAAVMGDAPRWFQLYWSTSNDLVESFVSRAEACGCEAIVVTLDTTPPDEPSPRPTLGALRTLIELTAAHPGPLLANLRSPVPRAAVQTFLDTYSRPSLTWADLAFLRERTQLPIVLKGILHPDDARRALDEGMDGVVVSNHGGRQVDGAISAIAALPGVVDAVGARAPVLLDSGIRGGADVFKARALGATAVLLGRPYAYGLAIGGADGVRDVLRNLLADFDLTMGLSGCASAAAIGPEALVRA